MIVNNACRKVKGDFLRKSASSYIPNNYMSITYFICNKEVNNIIITCGICDVLSDYLFYNHLACGF